MSASMKKCLIFQMIKVRKIAIKFKDRTTMTTIGTQIEKKMRQNEKF